MSRNFTVTETRIVLVAAQTPLEAATIADAAFRGEIEPGGLTEQHIIQPVRSSGIEAREEW